MGSLRLVSRRELILAGLVGGAGGAAGLVLGFKYGQRKERQRKRVPPRAEAFSPSVYLAIDTSGDVTIWIPKAEMGQGVCTSLAMLVADALDADWSRVSTRLAPGNENFGDQLTAVSRSVRSMWSELRAAGATARSMLIAAAAESFGCAADECTTERGYVIHAASGRRMSYGALAELAAQQPIPEGAPDTSSSDIVGTSLPRLDIPEKVDGSAVFGTDVRLPGLAFACVLRPPFLGARLDSVDDSQARTKPGYVATCRLENAVAVVGTDSWSAQVGRDALRAEWTGSSTTSSAEIMAAMRMQLEKPGAVVEGRGPAPDFSGTGRVVRADYEVPFLAHATMEPINATAHVRGNSCNVFAPTQAPRRLRDSIVRRFGFEAPRVVVQPTYVGGGFGRRVRDTEALEAVAISKTVGRPVQVLWTREDDVRHDFYRPAACHRLEARMEEDGSIADWRHRIVCPAIIQDQAIDPVAVEGATALPYATPGFRLEYTDPGIDVPTGFWRSVGHSHTAFAIESFVDELAAAAGASPVAYRRGLLAKHPRHLGVLDAAVARAGRAPAGRVHGVAVHASFGSWVAQVAEVSVREGRLRVHRVVCAVDCGSVVHPDTVKAQMEGGILFGLSAALHGRIDIASGAVEQGNFNDYPIVRFAAAPQIEVVLVPSEEAPGGVGEIGVPPIAPALANALAQTNRGRVRALPFG